jgi:hypothetical protein
MSALDTLRTVARGERPAGGALLQNCRLEAFGAHFYGEEAILEAFRAQPSAVATQVDAVACSGHIALFDGELALLADVYGDNVARIWRIGPGSPVSPEPALAVPFDPDLAQARGDLHLRPEDHPHLPPGAAEALRAWARTKLSGELGRSGLRTRLFLLRAFAEGGKAAALFAVHRLGAGPVRQPSFGYAAARFRLGEAGLTDARWIGDAAGSEAAEAGPWHPRL